MQHEIGKKHLSTKIKKSLVKSISYLISNRKQRKAFMHRWFEILNVGATEQSEKYEYLARYYAHIDIGGPGMNICENIDVSSLPIWQLWLQGQAQAPVLVQKCFASVAKYSQGRDIKILAECDLPKYLDLPAYIWDKYKNGTIPRAHFADIVRVCLLERYGGTWIDATILLTNMIPDNLLKQDFFAFSGDAKKFSLIDIWFLSAKPGHVFFRSMKSILFNYWKNESACIDYFFFHMLFTGMVESNPNLSRLWDECLHISFEPALALGKIFLEPFNAELLENIKEQTPIHKLTYFSKYQNQHRPNTFLEKFINSDDIFY